MTPKEILTEYNRDYPEIKRRMRSFLLSKNREFISKYKKMRKEFLFKTEKPRTTFINGNRYWIYLLATIGKTGLKQFEITVYQILNDSRTGKPRIWLLSTPSSNNQYYLLEFKPEVIKRILEKPEKTLKELIDYFMGQSISFTLYDRPNSDTYNFEVSFKSDDINYVAFGNSEIGRYIFEKVYSFSEIEEIGDSIELDGEQDPLNVYNAWIKSKENPKSIDIIFENLSEEERKKKEIELAWKEYANT